MATKTEVSSFIARQIINIVAFVALVVIAVCAGSVPYNNNYLMDVVSKYNPDFMAAAYSCYVINILIYVFLLCFIIYQGFTHRRNDRAIRSIDYLFWVFVVASIIWTFGFFYDVQSLAFVGMIIAAAAAFFIYAKLGIGRDKVTRAHYWCVHVPFSLIAATMIFGVVSQVSIFCIRYDLVWWGMGQVAWTVVAMLLVGFFGALFLQLRPDCIFGIAMIWLSAGVAVYQGCQDESMVNAFAYLLVLYFGIVTFANGMHRPRISKRESTK
jgi:hypothetical protein